MKDVSFITDYVGIPTFYNAPQIKLEDVKEGMAVVAGAPIDMGILFMRPGTRFGPRSIREASLMYRGLQGRRLRKDVGERGHAHRPAIEVGD